MRYEDYIGNLARLAVELVNTGTADGLTGTDADLLSEHQVSRPTAGELAPLLALLGPAMAAVADGTDPSPASRPSPGSGAAARRGSRTSPAGRPR